MVESLLKDNHFVYWNRSKIMLVGQGRAGKTALANNLMGKDLEEDTESTIGAKKFERKLMCGRVRNSEKGVILEEYISSSLRELESVMAMTSSRKINKLQSVETSGNDDNVSSYKDSDPSPAVSKFLKVPDINTTIFNKCLSENIARKDLGSELIISLYDFGGQDIFNVLHHFFMSKNGVYVVVFDMELFVSKDVEKRESCMKHLKFWMNSIVMHTYDEQSRRTAPVAIVGTRADLICESKDHNWISLCLEEVFYSSATWNSVLINYYDRSSYHDGLVNTENGLCFFPVNNRRSSLNFSAIVLLETCMRFLEDASFVKKNVLFIWLKILDEIKEKQLSFLSKNEVEEVAIRFLMSGEEVAEMLSFFCQMGMLIWINEDKLREIVILDPIEYFVKPVTMIICKHIATTDDPYHTVHCEKIHKVCRKEWPEDWFQMLEFGLVSDRLARKLLGAACKNEDHVNKVLLLMQRYGLLTALPIKSSGDEIRKRFFVPASTPSNPSDYYVDRIMFSSYELYNKHDSLVKRRIAKRATCANYFDCIIFHFAFSTASKGLKHSLFSSSNVATNGFLPNGLFERFIGRFCGAIVMTVPDIAEFLEDNNFIAFKDIVRLKYLSRTVKITNLLDHNMIRIEFEKGPMDAFEKENLMFVHDFLYEMIQEITRECDMNLNVVTLLPVDPKFSGDRDDLLLPLSKLVALNKEKRLLRVDLNTVDGQPMSVTLDELRRSFNVWLGTSTIHPMENEDFNKVCLCS
jgi:GTPase SAR1 family protein